MVFITFFIKECFVTNTKSLANKDLSRSMSLTYLSWGKTTVKTYTTTAREPSIYVTDSPCEKYDIVTKKSFSWAA